MKYLKYSSVVPLDFGFVSSPPSFELLPKNGNFCPKLTFLPVLKDSKWFLFTWLCFRRRPHLGKLACGEFCTFETLFDWRLSALCLKNSSSYYLTIEGQMEGFQKTSENKYSKENEGRLLPWNVFFSSQQIEFQSNQNWFSFKGRVTAPKWMNFRKSSTGPLAPPPIIGKL